MDVNWGNQGLHDCRSAARNPGDAPLSLAQSFPLTGTVIVTQPQDAAIGRPTQPTRRLKPIVPILGVVENMAGDFFGTGGRKN